jgi:hypothetical protein
MNAAQPCALSRAKLRSESFFDLDNLDLVCRGHHEQREREGEG